MKGPLPLKISVRSHSEFRSNALSGPIELSWNHILDLIFAHAYHQQIGMLNLDIPESPALETLIQDRAGIPGEQATPSGEDTASAWLLPAPWRGKDPGRYMYHVSSSRRSPKLRNLALVTAYAVWTRQSRRYGAGVRVADRISPRLRDYWMNCANDRFTQNGNMAAKFHLYIYENREAL